MGRLRLWLTIVNNYTAQQGVERGRNGALLCASFFALLAYDGWRNYKGQGTEGMILFAVFFALFAWGIHRGSAVVMDMAMICFPFGVAEAFHQPPMQLGGYWSGSGYLFVLVGFELLNGVRGASYLRASQDLRWRDDCGEFGEAIVATESISPPPVDGRMPESM